MSFCVQKYLPNLFVSIVLDSGVCHVMGKILKNNAVAKTFKTIIDNPQEDKLSEELISYLGEMANECRFVYIALYLNVQNQGAISELNVENFHKYNLLVKDIDFLHVDNKWTLYTDTLEVKRLKSMFSPFGLDLLYSPFVLIYDHIKNASLREKPTLYVYYQENHITIAIFDKLDLLFSAFHVISYEEEDEDSGDNFLELDELELDDMDEDLDEESGQDTTNDKLDRRICEYLTNDIRKFYEHEDNKEIFLNDIVIFDDFEFSQNAKEIIENELIMDVEVKKVSTLELMYNLAVKDIFS